MQLCGGSSWPLLPKYWTGGVGFFWIRASSPVWGFLPPRSVLTGASPSANQFLGGFLVQAQVFGELLQWRKNSSFSKITIPGVRGGKHWQF